MSGMDGLDRRLRDLLDAAAGEPPHLFNVERVRRRVIRRRALEYMAGAAAVAVIAVAIPTGLGVLGHPPGPAAHRRPATLYIYASIAGSGENVVTPVNTATNTPGKPIHVRVPGGPSYPGGMIVITPDGKTVYVTRSANSVPHGTSAVIPISTATGTPGTPVRVAGGSFPVIAVTPDGKTAYVITDRSRTVTPISTATGTPGTPIHLADALDTSGGQIGQIVFTPDGKTAYVTTGPGVTPISTATNTPSTPIRLGRPFQEPYFIAVTPDGKTAYVTESGTPAHLTATVTPINTATNTAGRLIDLSVAGVAQGIVITPDGKTAYVSTETGCQAGPGSCALTITPVSTATNTPGTPIHLGVGPQGCTGQTGQIAISPDGKTVYVTTGSGLTPISTATNTPGIPINVGASPPDSCHQIVFTPDGKTAYVTTRSGVTPISTATGTPGKPIKVGALGTYAEAIAITP